MKSTKNFNNISAELKKQITPLKQGEKVIFQMLNGVPNPEPDEKERSRTPVLYGKVQIPTNFKVYDKYLKDESGNVTGGIVEVGCVETWDGDKPLRFRRLVPGEAGGSQFAGKFELNGNSVSDVELYEVLFIHPERKGSDCSDESLEPVFEIVNAKADTLKVANKIDILRKALDILKTISKQDQLEVMAALNQPTYQDDDILKLKVSELAKDNPDDFIKAYESKDRSTVAMLKTAYDQNIITYEVATGNVLLGKTTVATIAGNELTQVPSLLAEYLKNAKNGEQVLENIKAQVAAKEPAKVS